MRLLPKTIPGWIGLVLAMSIAVYLIYPIITYDPERGMRYAKELSNLKSISIAIHAYAAEHDGLLPGRVSILQAPEHEYIPADMGMDLFCSPFHENAEMAHELVDEDPPTDWYKYGHYHFYPTAGLNLNDIDNAADFVLAYGSIQGDPPQHAVVFLDGSARWVAIEELRDLMERQKAMPDAE